MRTENEQAASAHNPTMRTTRSKDRNGCQTKRTQYPNVVLEAS
jgi:hypothetical protein